MCSKRDKHQVIIKAAQTADGLNGTLCVVTWFIFLVHIWRKLNDLHCRGNGQWGQSATRASSEMGDNSIKWRLSSLTKLKLKIRWKINLLVYNSKNVNIHCQKLQSIFPPDRARRVLLFVHDQKKEKKRNWRIPTVCDCARCIFFFSLSLTQLSLSAFTGTRPTRVWYLGASEECWKIGYLWSHRSACKWNEYKILELTRHQFHRS